MVDAPETIGLVASPFGLRLWNREEDDSEAGVIRYLRADIAERQLAEARAQHSGELQRANSLYEQAVAAEAEARVQLTEKRRDRIGDSEISGAHLCRAEKAEAERDRRAAEVARLRMIVGDMVDHDLMYDGGNIVIPCADHGSAIALVRRARAALASVKE